MIARYNRRSLALGIPGIILQLGGWVGAMLLAGQPREDLPVASLASIGVALLGTVLLLLGLGWYAKAKGHSVLWGVGGILGLIGLVILALLPDRARDPEAPAGSPTADNLIARVSIYLGIAGILPLLGLPFALAGLICGLVGLRRSRARGGRGKAIAGISISGFFLLAWTALFVLVMVLSWMEQKERPRPRRGGQSSGAAAPAPDR